MNAFTVKYLREDRLVFRFSLIVVNTIILVTLYMAMAARTEGRLAIDESTLCTILGFSAQVLTLLYYVSWGRITGNNLSLFGMFLISFVLFCLGQVILYSYDIRSFMGANMFTRLSLKLINTASLYTLICIVAFFSGALFVIDRPRRPASMAELDCYLAAFRKVGKILLLISFLPFIYSRTSTMLVAQRVGYDAFNDYSNYGSSQVFKLVRSVSSLFIIGLFLLLVGYRHNEKKRNLITLFLVVSAVSTLMMGERTGATSLLITVFWYRSSCLPKKRSKKSFSLLIVSVLLLLVFPAVQRLRHEGIISVSQLSQTVASSGISESLIGSIASVGFSVFPLAKTMEIVPAQENFRYGITYLMALTTVFPNLFFEVHPAQKFSALASWLMKRLDMTYGPGYSMPAEAYINFGWFPVPIMLLAGYLIARLLYITKSNRDDPLRVFAAMLFFFMNITLPRREFLGVVRDIAYYIVPAYFILKGMGRKRWRSLQAQAEDAA